MRWLLFVWYAYTLVLALLMAASAGTRPLVGKLALGAAAVALLLLAALFRWPFGHYETVTLGAQAVLLVAGLAGLALAPRADTRNIALLLAGASALPLLLRFWRPGA